MKTIQLSLALAAVLAISGCSVGVSSYYDPHGYDAAGTYYGSEYGTVGFSYTSQTGERY